MLLSRSSAASVRSVRLLTRVAFILGSLLLTLSLPGRASAQTTYSSSTLGCSQGGNGVSISGSTASGQCTMTVSGASGTVSSITLQLNGVTSSASSGNLSVCYTAFTLKGPNNQTLIVLGATGSCVDAMSGVTINIADANGAAPLGGQNWQGTGTANVKPSSYWTNAASAGEPVPASLSGDNLAQTDGSATLNNTFDGGTANGAWTLGIVNALPSGFTNADPVSVSNWSITMTFAAAAATTTTVSSNLNPSFTTSPNNSTTLTATVSSGSGTPTGTVAFTDNGNTIAGCTAQALSGGHATCTTTFSTHGTHPLKAAYAGNGAYGPSNGSMTELVEAHPTQSSNTWCNGGSITIPSNEGIGSVYPSVIPVSGYPGGTTVANVQVQLVGETGNIFGQHLLVAPDGTHNLEFFSGAWYNSTGSALNLNFFDSAGVYPNYPDGNNSPSAGSYEPSDDLFGADIDIFPSATAPTIDSNIPQVPGTIHLGYNPAYPNDKGPSTNTFENEIGGAPANGDWVLYTYENDAYSESINGGWCVAFTLNTGVATTTTLGSGNNPQTAGQSAALTATVKAGGSPVTSGGTVTFLDNGQKPSGNLSNVITLNGSGLAAFNTNATSYTIDSGNGQLAISEGDHNFTAEYSGTSSDNPSASTTLWQRFDNTTTVSGGSGNSGSYSYCNADPVISAQGNSGAFLPNPSNVFVTNLPGTVNTVGVTLKGLYTVGETSTNMETMLAGPNNKGLDFFSNTGSLASTTSFSTGNYTFQDGGTQVPANTFGPSIYAPTAYGTTPDTFTSSKSGFYNVPGTINYAAPHASSTFFSTFGGGTITGDGTWSLFFNEAAPEDGTGASNGWCVNFTQNQVTAGVVEAHSGTGVSGDLIQGETGAALTTVVTNNGTGSAGDPAGSNTNPATVVDTLNAALTFNSALTTTSNTGTGWSCAAVAQVVTCKNDAANVAQGAAYPTLTINVNVSASAPGTVANQVSISGADFTGTSSNTDNITVDPYPALSVAVSHPGTFTQGQTATWKVTVSDTSASGQTSGTITVGDTLPSGYTLVGSTSTNGNFGCGAVANVVTCTSTTAIAGGSNNVINLQVGVPANSPVSVSDSATAYGGGDPNHSTSGTAAVSNTDSVTVVQVPASVTINGLQTQSTSVGTAFGSLAVTVKDAAGVVIPNYSSVSFTASTAGSGASGTFSNSTNTISVNTNGLGVADPGTFTANLNSGTYSVSVMATPTATASFSFTNLAVTPTFTWSPAATIIVGSAGANVLNASMSCGACGTITYTATPSGGSPSPITDTSGLPVGVYTITANFTPGTNEYNPNSTTAPLTVNGESVWVVNSGGGTAELAGNGAPITSSAYPGANLAAAIDATGNVWTIGTGTTLLGAISQTGINQYTITSGGGLDNPSSVAIDGNSQVWITNAGNNSVSLFLDNGTPASPSSGFTDSSLSNPSGVTVDLGGSVWIANQGNSTVTRILGAAAPAAPPSTAAANNTTGARP